MTLTLLPALQHGSFDMWFQCCFCRRNVFNWAVLLCKQELAALIRRNEWTSNIVQENNKSLNTLKIFIANTGSHGQSKIKCHRFHRRSKTKSVLRPAYVVGSCMLARPGSDLRRKRKNKQHTHVCLFVCL